MSTQYVYSNQLKQGVVGYINTCNVVAVCKYNCGGVTAEEWHQSSVSAAAEALHTFLWVMAPSLAN